MNKGENDSKKDDKVWPWETECNWCKKAGKKCGWCKE